MEYTCKICGSKLVPILSYKNQPITAQFLPKDEESADKNGIDLNIHDCVSCGTVQLPVDPVFYYKRAIASSPWHDDPFRVIQLNKFISEFNLENKKIKKVCEEPEKENYDAFLMFNYLEHFIDPIKTLKQIGENLPQGGVGIVEVPNFDDIIKERLFGEFIIDHLFYFTKRTLWLACELSGFEVIRIEEIWNGASLSATIKKRNILNVTPFRENEEKLISDIDTFIDKHNSVAIWGAGHQTLMYLTMLKNTNKIAYIVDDFKIKQDMFSYVNVKKIVPREYLTTTPVDAVIIIVGWQYPHVLNSIKNMGIDFNLAIIKKATLEFLDKNNL